ncbi:MAG: hypothetical protein ACKVKV_05875, partial [Dehalococcoidia bacterium]
MAMVANITPQSAHKALPTAQYRHQRHSVPLHIILLNWIKGLARVQGTEHLFLLTLLSFANPQITRACIP